MGEHVAGAADRGLTPSAGLEIQADGLTAADDLSVVFNGVALQGAELADGWLKFAPDPAGVRKGPNSIAIRHTGTRQKPVELKDVQLWTRYTRP